MDVIVAPGNHGAIRPWITNFEARSRPSGTTLKGVIEVEPARIATESDQELDDEMVRRFDAEMVRTLSVAVQFDTVKYLIPLRYVYGEAVNIQENWLENRRGVMLDPRNTDHKIIVRNLLGDEVYYGDFGFEHWRNGINELLMQELGTNTNLSRINALEILSNDYEAFKVARAKYGTHPEFKGSFNLDLRQKYDEMPFEALALGNAIRTIDQVLEEVR